jgi:hypothetical protein
VNIELTVHGNGFCCRTEATALDIQIFLLDKLNEPRAHVNMLSFGSEVGTHMTAFLMIILCLATSLVSRFSF